jgi:hypothetical protein
MDKLKELLLKSKKWLLVVLAGAVIAFIAWKKHLESEISDKDKETAMKDAALKEEASKRLAEEAAKLEEQKKLELAKIEDEKKKKESSIKAEEIKEKVRLAKLAKENKEDFKKEVAEKTGVAEKKKGRPKKK